MKVKLPVVGSIVLCYALQVAHQLEHRRITHLNTIQLWVNEGEASCCGQHCSLPCPSGRASLSDSTPKPHTTVRLMKVKLPVVGGIVLCHALQDAHHCGIAHLNPIQL
jgi:hypothetical protein